MASIHAGSVMRNLCYTAPRHPSTDKPATENERIRNSLEAEPPDDYGLEVLSDRPPSSRRHKRHHQGHKPKRSVRESLSESLRELDDVDEEHFYEHLLALKNEHKKTLKSVEKLYYSEKDKHHSGFQLDSRTKIAVDDFDESRISEQFPLHHYNPFRENTEIDGKENIEIPVVPEDHVKDMSVRGESRMEHKESEGKNNYFLVYFLGKVAFMDTLWPRMTIYFICSKRGQLS